MVYQVAILLERSREGRAWATKYVTRMLNGVIQANNAYENALTHQNTAALKNHYR